VDQVKRPSHTAAVAVGKALSVAVLVVTVILVVVASQVNASHFAERGLGGILFLALAVSYMFFALRGQRAAFGYILIEAGEPFTVHKAIAWLLAIASWFLGAAILYETTWLLALAMIGRATPN
jgi:hypothetical protein